MTSLPGSKRQTPHPCFPGELSTSSFSWHLWDLELPSTPNTSLLEQCQDEAVHLYLHLYKGVNKALSEKFLGTSVLVGSARHVQFIITKNNIAWNIWVPFIGLLICRSALCLLLLTEHAALAKVSFPLRHLRKKQIALQRTPDNVTPDQALFFTRQVSCWSFTARNNPWEFVPFMI